MKRLTVFLDGTWQKLDQPDPTNIAKLAQSVAHTDSKAVEQIVYYDRGVGADSMTRKARRRLLRDAGFIRLDEWLAQARKLHAKTDDILDACALLLTAQRIYRGDAVALPQSVARDARGLRMAIRY